MKRSPRGRWCLLFSFLTITFAACAGRRPRPVVAPPCPECDAIEARIRDFSRPPRNRVRGETIHLPATLARFYRARGFRPAWTEGACLLPVSAGAIDALVASDREGLNPDE